VLAAGVERRDAAAVVFAAHRLRGQAASVEADAVVRVLEELEAAAREESWSDAVDALGPLEEAIQAFVAGRV
jgi:HPt (histidine-containing phosphotransfer) domain-containing protein